VYEPRIETLQISEAQIYAHEALDGNKISQVPETLLVKEKDGFVIQSFFEGLTCAENLFSTSQDITLNKMGNWCHDLHSSTFHETRRFQPKFMVNYLIDLNERIKSGRTKISEPRLFARCAEKLPDIADQFERRYTNTAQLHGQLNVGNFLFGSQATCVSHFRPFDVKPIGYDISRLLVDFMLLHGDISELSAQKVIPDSILLPFFEAYEFRPINDPSISFLMYTRLLENWYEIHSDPMARSVEQETRLERILQIAEIGFDL